MHFHSTKDKKLRVDFQTALLTSMAQDGGLYVPSIMPDFSRKLDYIATLKFEELAFEIAKEFIDREIPEKELREICKRAFNFPAPLVELDHNHAVLELFHGPTSAFKDFAARFMAQCSSYFLKQKNTQKTILVATSGDTGSAVGSGFFDLPNIRVFILYPKGGISLIQEKQLTTIGKNVRALEIDGSFDDCQRLVKEAFMDDQLNSELNLMSANSINIGRVIPQSFYYAWISLKLREKCRQQRKQLVFSVPSGNFGNVTGGLWARKMGFPIDKIIAANNDNHPFCAFLESGKFVPVPSVQTLSNAMDIGHPNNFYRINYLFDQDIRKIREVVSGFYFNNEETAAKIKSTFTKYKYLPCPHTAVGLLGVEKFQQENDGKYYFVTIGTADPAKFCEVVEKIIGKKVKIPAALQAVLKKEKKATVLSAKLSDLQKFLLNK